MDTPEPIAVTHGYECRYTWQYRSVVGRQPVFQWTKCSGPVDYFVIGASPEGVVVRGTSPLLDIQALNDLNSILGLAQIVGASLSGNDRDTDAIKQMLVQYAAASKQS